MKYLLLIVLIAGCNNRTYRSEGEPLYRIEGTGWDVTAKDTFQFKRFLQGKKDTFTFRQTGLKVFRDKPKRIPPQVAIYRRTPDTMEIVPNDMIFLKVAGNMFQVERSGKWIRIVDGAKDNFLNYVPLSDLQCDPYAKLNDQRP